MQQQPEASSGEVEFSYRILFERSPFAMWVYDLDTRRFLAVNEAAITGYGYSRSEFLSMRVDEIRPADDVPRLLAFIEEATGDDDGWMRSGEWRHRHRSGETLDVEVLSHPVTFAGRSARMVLSRDVTERRLRDERLRAAEARMRFALESSKLGIWEANLTTGVTYWSETCEAMHGLEAGAFGQTFTAFIERIHPEDRPLVQQQIDTAMREHRPVELEYRTGWPDGTEHRIASTAHFYFDEASGAPSRGAGVTTDVTERRQLEAQLRQSQKMDAIGQLAGGVAHDFNNLLTAILGNADVLLEECAAGTRLHRLLTEIRKAGDSAASLTRQLLAFSRKQVLSPGAACR